MLYKRTSSSSLVDLASQLYSPEDRHQYTKVILKKERMRAQIEFIQTSLQQHYQQYHLEKQQQQQEQQKVKQEANEDQPLPPIVKRKPTFRPTHPNVRHSMSSYSMLLSKSASMYQPKLLEQYDASHLLLKQIDVLSNQYNNSNTMEQLLMKKVPSSTTSSSSSPPTSPASSVRSKQSNISSLITDSSTGSTPALKVKTTNLSSYHHLQRHHHLPISPPLSPPSSSICLSTSSSTSYPISPKSTCHTSSFQSHSPYLQKSAPSSSISSSSSQIPDTNTTMVNKKISADLPSTPIASPILHTMQQNTAIPFNDNNNSNQTPFYYPAITHIQKNNGMRIRSFLGQSILLNKTIRLEQQRVSSDPRFYQGREEASCQAKVILKLVIIKSAKVSQDEDAMAPFGIHFENSAVSGGSTANMSLHAWIPDSLVLEALTVWLVASQLPHLLNACHVMRDGMKLYIVYNASVIY